MTDGHVKSEHEEQTVSVDAVHADDMYFPAPHDPHEPHEAAFVVVEKFVPGVQSVHTRFTEAEHDVETY